MKKYDLIKKGTKEYEGIVQLLVEGVNSAMQKYVEKKSGGNPRLEMVFSDSKESVKLTVTFNVERGP